MFVVSKPLALLQGNELATLGYMAIAPSVLVVSGISIFRGYFQGMGRFAPSALSQITESFAKLLFGLALAYILLPYGVQYAVMGALIGITISEILTFVYLYIVYKKSDKHAFVRVSYKDAKENYKEILAYSIPITIGSFILPLSQFIDSVLVINLLERFGHTVQNATASYGLFTGPVATLINLPIVLGLSLAVVVVPEFAKAKEEHNMDGILQRCQTCLKMALIIGVPFCFIYLTMSEQILTLLYPALTPTQLGEGSILLRIGSITIIFLSLMQIYTSMLQGLSFTKMPVKNLAISVLVRTIMTIMLIPYFGILGVQIASLVSFAIAMVLNAVSLRQIVGKYQKSFKNSSAILLSGAIMGGVMMLSLVLLKGVVSIIMALIFGMLTYGIIILATGVFSEKELYSLPLGKFFVAVSKIFRRKTLQ